MTIDDLHPEEPSAQKAAHEALVRAWSASQSLSTEADHLTNGFGSFVGLPTREQIEQRITLGRRQLHVVLGELLQVAADLGRAEVFAEQLPKV